MSKRVIQKAHSGVQALTAQTIYSSGLQEGR